MSLGIKYLRILVPEILHSNRQEDLKGHDNSKQLVCQQNILIQVYIHICVRFTSKDHKQQ